MLADQIIIGDKYDPAMKITDQSAADAYFEQCVEHTMRMRPCEREEAERIERSNLGYYAGYCSDETRRRVERLFRCAHPLIDRITFDATEAGFSLDMSDECRRQIKEIEDNIRMAHMMAPMVYFD